MSMLAEGKRAEAFPPPPLWVVVGAPEVTVGKESATHLQWMTSYEDAGLR